VRGPEHGVVVVLGDDEDVALVQQAPERRIESVRGVVHEGDASGVTGQSQQARERAAAAKRDPRGLGGPGVSPSSRRAAVALQEFRHRRRDFGRAHRRSGGIVHVVIRAVHP